MENKKSKSLIFSYKDLNVLVDVSDDFEDTKTKLTKKLTIQAKIFFKTHQDDNGKQIVIDSAKEWENYFLTSNLKKLFIVEHRDPSDTKLDREKLIVDKTKSDSSPKNIFFANYEGTDVQFKLPLNHKDPQNGMNEIAILSKLPKHENLVPFFGLLDHFLGTVLVIEWGIGSLQTALRKEPAFNLAQKLKFCLEIAQGINFLHEQNLIHRNLSSENCLLYSKDLNLIQIKISDLRFATHFDSKSTSDIISDIKVPLPWNSLESLTENKYSKASDIWSFGVIMWEIFTDGQIPYQSEFDISDYLIAENKRLVLPDSCPPKVSELIQKCWEKDPKQRPNASEIVTFFKNYEEEIKSQPKT